MHSQIFVDKNNRKRIYLMNTSTHFHNLLVGVGVVNKIIKYSQQLALTEQYNSGYVPIRAR